MTKTELTALLDELGIRPSRRLGQNFLIDQNLLEAIVRSAAPQPGERILEIGPGTGVLTTALLDAGSAVTAVEFDHRLAAYLRRRLGDCERFTLVEGDACTVDYAELLGECPYRCIANLPYAVSSVFLARMTALANPPTALVILLQREMADRLMAGPHTKAYGALSVKVQLLYRVRRLRTVPPTVFHPPPEVASALMLLERRDDAAAHADRQGAEALARAAFSQRRKKAVNLWRGLYPAAAVNAALEDLGVAVAVRAEDIGPDTYVELSRRLRQSDSKSG